MKIAFALLFLLVLASLGCVQEAGQPAKFNKIESRVAEKAIDGDTILLQNREKVRLIGLDASEKGEECWAEARDRLQDLVGGKRIVMERDFSERDKYGRLVRFVYVNGFFVNLAMVEEGLAEAFEFEPDVSRAGEFKAAEQRASKEGGCLWK
jgi:micrococcal nuclease